MLTTRRNNGSRKTLSDLHNHAQCFLVTIHVPSSLTFLLVMDVTMTSCKNTIVLVVLNFKHVQMSLRFLYTNVGRLLFFNLDNLASSPGSSRFRLLLSCRRHIEKREDPGDEVDVTNGSQFWSIAKI